ncbi:EAL domain-containing response regulator [Acidovorax cavernicola]|nr:EAL domain-containing protein [Acidovorax cavernicola]
MIRNALVIDQVERTGLALATFMRYAGIPRVDVTRSGHGFVEALQQHRHDLLVVDIDTPEVTGLQMIDAVVEADSPAKLVLMSAQPPRILQAAVDYAGARGARVLSAIAKPSTMVTMASAAQVMARGRRHRAEPRRGTALPAGDDAPAFTAQVLGAALATRQITAHFQPRHCARTGVLRGAELQPCWYRPDDTWLPGADFLPAIAHAGLGAALTQRMLDCAFELLGYMHPDHDLRLGVRVSASIAGSVAWAQDVAEQAERAGIAADRLMLEIAEDGGARCNDVLAGAVAHLRLRGFHCAIDRFGQGDSTLSRWLKVPFSEIQIDARQLAQARENPHARHILASLIAMAREQDATLLVKGADSEQDLALARSVGCHFTQGMQHAEAMPEQAFAQYAALLRYAAQRQLESPQAVAC